MERNTFALYAKAIRGEDAGAYVFCWNFSNLAIAISFAEQRKDVGDIHLFKHVYNDNNLIMKEYLETFEH